MVADNNNDWKILDILYRNDNGKPPQKAELVMLNAKRELSFHATGYGFIPKSIVLLTNLEKLDLSALTQLTDIPDSIGQLTKLTDLILNGTSISKLPESLSQLGQLENLQLSRTNIDSIPDSFANLSCLRRLNLSKTNICVVPPALECLKKITDLDLSDTRITSLPNWIGRLPALRYLNLSGLSLIFIPESLALCGLRFFDSGPLGSDQEGIDLSRVNLKEQNKAIFTDSQKLIPSLYGRDQKMTLRECRVIFLGDGATGKTYTIRRFCEKGKKETPETPYITQETPGVEIVNCYFEDGNEPISVHFWDFGGQQLLHSMHRCFLTEETCYVVMVKTRETKASERARYWLRNVEAFAPYSPVLLLVNCWGNDTGQRSIDEPQIRVDYPNIVDVTYCSAKEADEEEFLNKIVVPIYDMVSNSEGISKKVPIKWNTVRKSIEKESKQDNYLTRQRYHDICECAGIADDQAPDLLSFFNNLGVCFSYHLDHNSRQELAEYKLLNPVWLTNALYAIIEEGMVFANEGQISQNAIKQMLCNIPPVGVQGKPYRRTAPDIVYTEIECGYIIDVAVAHDLCFRVNESTLFFPALCSTDTPQSALSVPNGLKQHISYLLQYNYLPDSVLHQLIIRCLRNHLAISSCWLRGVVLEVWTIHKAYVRMIDEEKLRIDVYSSSSQRTYELFWHLRTLIDEVNRKLNLSAKEYIQDGNELFPLGSVLAAARKNTIIFGSDGSERNACLLLGEFYEESVVQTMRIENGVITIPITLKEFHRCSKDNKALRYALFEAYNRVCPYCSNQITRFREMEVDHILPSEYRERPELKSYIDYLESCGFQLDKPDYIENYFPAHPWCNRDKSNRVNAYSLPYWHDIAMQHTTRVLRLMNDYYKM